jgi:ribosome-associated translation inhibitor RaiA
MPRAKTIQIEETTSDIYGCLDLARDRLLRVAKRELEKRRKHR